MAKKKRELSDAQYQKMYGKPKNSTKTGSSKKGQSSSSSGRNKGEMTGSSYSSRTYSTPSKSASEQANERGRTRTARTNVQQQQSYTPTRTNTVHGRNDSDINRYNRITGSSSTAQNSMNRNVGMNRTQGSSSNTDRTSAGTAARAKEAWNRLEEDRKAREAESRARRNQKMTGGVTKADQQKSRQRFATARELLNERAKEAQKTKMGAQVSEEEQTAADRAFRNTPGLAKKAILDTVQGHGKTIADLTELTASNKNGTDALAMKMGIQDDPRKRRELEKQRQETVKRAKEDRERWQKEQDKRQAAWDKQTKNAKGLEKAYYGAVESGVGMLTDTVLGLGNPGASLAAMGSRTYGSTRGQARKEGATERKDRLYSLLQAGKEVGTELMFPGVGLARRAYGRAGLPLAEKAANALTRSLRGRTADITRAGLRLLGGIVEENAEEIAGWGLDPLIKEFTYGRNVRRQDAKETMHRVSNSIRSNIQSEEDAVAASAYLSSASFLEDTKREYMAEGMSEADAEEVAQKMRDFLTASLIGDTDTMERLEDEVSKKVAGTKLNWDWKELGETIASTTLLTGVTGLPGAITTAARGAAIRDELGADGVRALANTAIDFEDEKDSYKGQAARDRIDSGKELTSTQVYDLAEAMQKQAETDNKRNVASKTQAIDVIENEKLVIPYGVNQYNGDLEMDDAVADKYESDAREASNTIRSYESTSEGSESLTDTEVRNGSKAIAEFKSGIFTVEDANELNYRNTAVRSAFESETGVNLEQYVVKNKDGTVNVPATNAATKDALFAMAADNLVESARVATVNWMDNVKGEVVTQVTARMGAQGSVALQAALDDVDERNRIDYMMVVNASDMLYQSARNMGTEWDNVKDQATKMFPQIAESKLESMYNAGLEDRRNANDILRNRSIRIGNALTEVGEQERSPEAGRVYVDTETSPKGTVVRAFSELASNLGVDIHLVDNIETSTGKQANGYYINGAIYINVNSDFEQNMGYIFMHEVTHHLKMIAPEEYAALENLVREKWFEYDDAQMQNEIARKIQSYADAGQTLTKEEALEEIIADAAHEFLNDPNFANQVAEDNPTLTKAILNSVRNALRMLRRVLATGSIDDETHMNNLFSQLDIFDEAEKLWLNAYTAAYQNKAALAIDNWQDEVNAQRYSAPVERVKDLVAVHNVKISDLPNMLDLGGMPMPSIAVIKASMGHDKYGEISFLFHSNSIDPAMSRYNKVYGGDAYTPTFPAVRYKPNSEVIDRLKKLYYDNYKELGGDAVRGLYRYSEGLEDEINSAGGEAALIERAKKDTGLMESYLAMQGKPKVEDVYKTEETTLSDSQVEMHEMFIKELGEDVIKEVKVPEGENPLAYRKEWFKKHETEIEAAYTKWMKDDLKLDDETIQKVLDDQTTASYVKLFRETLKYLQDGATTTKEVYDGEATREAITKAAEEAGFDAWVDETFKGVEAGKGIRNNKDMFTNMGNRRSWDTLHDPVTLENVVAIMRSELDTGSNGFFGANPKGAAQKSYSSLDEIIADEDRLEMLSDEEYSAKSDEALSLFTDVCASIVESNPQRFGSSFGGQLDVGEIIAEVLNETRNKDKMHKLLNRDYGMTVSDEQMDKLWEAIQAIAEVPTGYFEAKPKRAVGFDEVKAALVPKDMDKDLAQQLSDRGVEIVEYDPEVEGDRTAKLNEVADRQDIKFSLNSEGEELSQGQETFFERSKNRNAEGQLKVMLHGTDADFTEFDPSKARPGTLGRAFYFSDSAAHAGQYGNVGRYYLNLENPLTGNTHDITKDQLRRFVAELAENEDYGIENYGADATVDSVTDSVWGGTDFVMLRDLNLSAVGDFAEAVKVFNRVNGTDYDGIITDVETAAFYPEQIKRTDNLNPTLSKDTRYSITDANGKDLSDGQVTYFRNSKARDEQGRLVPVFHATFRGGFTIFDPSYSDDHRSLFFAASKDISLTYGGIEANRPIDINFKPFNSLDEFKSAVVERYQQLNDEQASFDDIFGEHALVLKDNGAANLELSYNDWLNNPELSKDYDLEFRIPGGGRLRASNVDDLLAKASEAMRTDQRGYYECYLNLENPLIVDAQYHQWDEIPFANRIGKSVLAENIYDTRELAELAYSEGYDGVIIKDVVDIGSNADGIRLKNEVTDVYIAFNSNQVKDVNNLNPTENPDIRYSITPEDDALSRIAYAHAMDNSNEALEYYEQLIDRVDPETYNVRPFNEEKVAAFYAALNSDEAVVSADPVEEESRIRMARSKADFYNNLNTKWNDRWPTEGKVLDVKSVKTDIRNLVMGVMSNSDTDQKYRTELVNKMLMDVRTAFQLMKQDRQEVAASLLYHSALRMVESAEFYIDETYDQYKDLKEYFKNTKISLGEEYWSDVDYDAFRKANFGRLKLVKGTTNVDQVYQELESMFPEWFKEDENITVPDMLEQMAHVLDSVQPYREAYTSEAAAELAFDIADELYDIMVGGKEYKSLADQYKERYDAKTKAMKQRHAEAMLRMRRQRDLGVQAERAKWRAREEARKEKTAHNKYFDRINKNYNKLVKRLFDNTKDSHIPEQYKKELAKLLSAFDLQTVGSKKVQDRRGVWGKNTIKMAATKAALANISNRAQDFKVNDAITDLMDDLLASGIDGKTIDELSVPELQKIDDIMKALVHEFNNYDKVVKDNKKQTTAVFGNSQVDDCLKHAEIFGPGKDYHGLLGALDKIINLDEQTAAYLFRRIDPNYTGIGAMWKEVRKSFDKYVRNTAQLKEWMEEITGEYHNKGKLNKYGSDVIDSWRSANYARPIKLANGTVQLTPAQMMSIYCLAKRPQAYGHMVGAGIVVRPVSFNAKLMTDLKKKLDTSLPVILTDADIKTITKELTQDQIKVADKLQELMSTKMAAWGNEASMEVIGIELFHDNNYFPIKSDKAALESDLSADQFVDSVRNFGFAKAVAPGARNAIVVDDIFDVVAEHCNNMNLYNSYSRSMDDFMKVLNYRQFREDGREYTVKQAIGHAYSQKAVTFILQMMRDLNGNVSGGDSGISSMYNRLLSNAKAASVMGNGRVLLQQPTAITRAFAVINPKYIKGIRIDRGVLDEMWEHCPIALWKSWGYYDINMGRPIEDVIMNNGSISDDLLAGSYGVADNITWAAIWQMVKAEMKDTHPDVEIGTDEYWELANERMSEIVDFTQVVDSPIHRSHGMRSKNYLEKTATSFMAEPTLTFNMVKDGLIRTYESWKLGDKKAAAKILGVTASVFATQAVTVSIAQALWDTLRGKGGDDDDEEEKSKLLMIWQNFLENLGDEVKIWNKVYFIKDIDSLIRGYGFSNMALQGFKLMIDGWNQLTGTRKVFSSKSWYENFFGGLGYITGMPIQTLIRDTKAIYNFFGLNWNVANEVGEYLDSMPDAFKSNSGEGAEATTFLGKLMNIEGKSGESKSGKGDKKSSGSDRTSPDLNVTMDGFMTDEELEQDSKDKLAAVKDKVEGLPSTEKNQAIFDKTNDLFGGYINLIEKGRFDEIERMRSIIEAAGGNVKDFDAKVLAKSKTAYKKTLGDSMKLEQQWATQDYLKKHGVSDEEISELCYKSYTKSDLVYCWNNGYTEAAEHEMFVLASAGMSVADMEKAYKYRNRQRSYNGKYTDEEYVERWTTLQERQTQSTGKYTWPTDGIITSDFGGRSSPGGIGSTNHQGIDIGASTGTPACAVDGGEIVMAGWFGGYGNTVQIKHNDGTVTQYSHLNSINCNVGDRVAQGAQVGEVGSTGNSTGPHLHFGVMVDGNYVDPLDYLDASGKEWNLDA